MLHWVPGPEKDCWRDAVTPAAVKRNGAPGWAGGLSGRVKGSYEPVMRVLCTVALSADLTPSEASCFPFHPL